MNFPVPSSLLILVWFGFAVCLGLVLLGQTARNSFQKRMTQTVRPDSDDVREVLDDQQQEEMDRSFVERTLGPTFTKLGGSMKNQIKTAQGTQLRDTLEQAGHPWGMGVLEFLGFKMFCLMILLGIGILSAPLAMSRLLNLMGMPTDVGSSLLYYAIYVFIFAFLGYSGPTFWLRRVISKRIKHIRRAMADVVDLIVLGIEAGLGFDSAVGKTVEKTKGPLTDELKRVLAEVNVGRSQSEAFKDMAKRVRMTDLTMLVAAIDQAMKMGTGLGHALRLQATEIREKRMAYVREQAGKLPVKMMLPLVLFIFPALFVIILGPAACQMAEMAKRGELSMFG